MKTDHPTPEQIPQLLSLWKTIFGEYDGFWELFLETAFSPRRCLCVMEGKKITAALCWLDCEHNGQKLAYVYAVLTHPDYRGQGLCRTLMETAHAHLAAQGYDAALLVPAGERLRRMYETLGYEACTTVTQFTAAAGEKKELLRPIGPEEYAALRRTLLPEGSVLQEGVTLALLAGDTRFYAGDGILLAAYAEGDTLHVPELLGDAAKAPGILTALDCRQGDFRCPGDGKDFAMFHGLKAEARKPAYFGFALD